MQHDLMTLANQQPGGHLPESVGGTRNENA
jgi:hypothetical protein